MSVKKIEIAHIKRLTATIISLLETSLFLNIMEKKDSTNENKPMIRDKVISKLLSIIIPPIFD